MPPKKYTFPRLATAADSSQPKQMKSRKPIPMPAGVSDAKWRVDVQSREATTKNLLRRLDAKRIRDAAAAAAATVDQEEASCVGMMNPPGRNPQAFNYTDANIDEIITSGSVAAASHLEFGGQDETMDTTDDIDDNLDDAKEEEGEGVAVEVDSKPVPKKKGRKRKHAANAWPVGPRVKWMSKKDECLGEAWKTVSMDPITSVNQNTARSTIQMACNRWHGIIEEVPARPKRGANVEGQIIRTFAMYRGDNEDQQFRFLHVFSRIGSCEKWRKVWLTLDKAKETSNPDEPAYLRQKGVEMAPKNQAGEGRGARCRTAASFDRAMHIQRQDECCQEGGEIRCAAVGIDGEPARQS
ncbi:putative cysteine-rich receptor-like protein kinase 20 [Hordeum vulgare]|nr:putative cysteine-rich receptor-like protein kinase 20 [Hordeum vulgare]